MGCSYIRLGRNSNLGVSNFPYWIVHDNDKDRLLFIKRKESRPTSRCSGPNPVRIEGSSSIRSVKFSSPVAVARTFRVRPLCFFVGQPLTKVYYQYILIPRLTSTIT